MSVASFVRLCARQYSVKNMAIFLCLLAGFWLLHHQWQVATAATQNWVQDLTKAGLLGTQDAAGLTEYFTSSGQSVDEPTEAQRHERFSFAVARTLDTTEEQLQELLAMTSTAKRLTTMYDALADGRGYLAARSTLKDMF